MKGYWYVVACSIGIAGIAVINNQYVFMLILFLWLCYLFYNERLGKLPLIVSLSFSLFFSFYFPTKELAKQTSISTEDHQFTGTISRPLLITEERLEISLINHDQDKLLISYFFNDSISESKEAVTSFKYGAVCQVKGEIELPPKGRNPGQFDYRNFLLTQGISHQLILQSLEDIHCQGSLPLQFLFQLRENIIEYTKAKLSNETSAWLNALIFGNDDQLDQNTISLFQRWGIAHILAISGLHVGLVISLIYLILSKFNVFTRERTEWFMIMLLPIYAILAGGKPSVWRATSMTFLVLLYQKTQQKLPVTDIFSLVFIVLLLADKYMIYQIGFQFSFIVTFGLILSRKLLQREKSYLWQMFYISFIAQMIILPLQLHYFSTFRPLSILLNVIIVPYFSLFAIPFLFFLLLLLPLPAVILQWLDQFFIHIHQYMLILINWLDHQVHDVFVIGEFSLLYAMIYYVCFLFMMKCLENNKLRQSFAYGCCLVALLLSISLRPYFTPTGIVTMLDINQGDAIIIELPYRKGVIMIDAGAQFSFTNFEATNRVYEQIIKPYLYSRGIQQIDAVFLTHKDLDHMGSFAFILEEFKVKDLYISPYYELDHLEVELLVEKQVDINRIEPAEEVLINGHSFYVLGPLKNENNENDNSLVLYSQIGGLGWLFTGDISKRIERQIASTYHLSVDVLKVAHHGSQTSTDPHFLAMTNPTIALISVGVNNAYNHPATEVIDTLDDHGITIYRTDEGGAIRYHFQEAGGTFSTFLP